MKPKAVKQAKVFIGFNLSLFCDKGNSLATVGDINKFSARLRPFHDRCLLQYKDIVSCDTSCIKVTNFM